MAKDAYYFSHDSNARNDIKIQRLRACRYGLSLYGIYWMIIEVLRETDNNILETDYKTLAFDFRCSVESVRKVVEDFSLFVVDQSKHQFYSARLLRNMSKLKSKSEMATNSAKKRWQNEVNSNVLSCERNANALPTQCDGNALNKSKVKESKGKESKVNKSKVKKIILLFNLLNFDEDKLNNSIISRTQILIDKFSYQEVQSVFLRVSELDEKKKNIAYIEAILNTPKKQSQNSNSEPQTQWNDLTPTYEEYIRDNECK